MDPRVAAIKPVQQKTIPDRTSPKQAIKPLGVFRTNPPARFQSKPLGTDS